MKVSSPSKPLSERLMKPTAAQLSYRQQLAEERALEIKPKDDIWWNHRSPKNEHINKTHKNFDHVESKLAEPTYASLINHIGNKKQEESPKSASTIKPIVEESRLLVPTTSRLLKSKLGAEVVEILESPTSPNTNRSRRLSLGTDTDTVASTSFTRSRAESSASNSPRSPFGSRTPKAVEALPSNSPVSLKPINLNSRLLQTTASTYHSKWNKSDKSPKEGDGHTSDVHTTDDPVAIPIDDLLEEEEEE